MSLTGQLDLVCAADEDGGSFLRRQAFCAPFHLSKPYRDEHALVVQIANPTAGLFAGDMLRSRVEVERGGRLLLTTPSANRAHLMPSGQASVEQSFRVANGGWLEVMPELFIPQAGCSYRQRTAIEIEAGGEMFFVESLAPGRVARGEIFQFDRIDWQFDLHFAGRLVARERFLLRPGDRSLEALRQPFPHAYFASCYLISDRIAAQDEVWKRINALGAGDRLIGASRLQAGGWGIKILAESSLALRSALRSIRGQLAHGLPPLRSSARKL